MASKSKRVVIKGRRVTKRWHANRKRMINTTKINEWVMNADRKEEN